MSLFPNPNQPPELYPDVASRLTIDQAHLASLGLTRRECEVMQWICDGKRDREIAAILGLSPRTVEKHVCHIFVKLEVETRTAAASECRYYMTLSRARSALTTPKLRARRATVRSALEADTPRARPRQSRRAKRELKMNFCPQNTRSSWRQSLEAPPLSQLLH